MPTNSLQAKEITLGELCKSVGYATGYVGKWHLGSEEQSWPARQGFDEYRVGVIETSDSTLYRPQMERLGFPEAAIEKKAPGIWDGTTKDGLKRVREYDVEYKHIVEDEIATASVKIINKHAAAKEPFFLLVGLTQTHYPNVTSPEFSGKSENGPYADALLQHDHAVGEILDAIQKSGIEDNTMWATVHFAPMRWRISRRAALRGIAAVSSRMDLLTNKDGSIDLYFGPDEPKGKKQNWIPTEPGRAFFAMLRFYSPGKTLLDRSWVLPDIEKAK